MSTSALHDALENYDFSGPESPLIKISRRLQLVREVTADTLDEFANENRSPLASESRTIAKARQLISDLEERKAELAEQEKREAAAAASRVLTGNTGEQRSGPRGGIFTSSVTYHRGNNSPSFFRDLWRAQRGDADAADRLRSNNRETGQETRALGNTGGTGGSGGDFAPPAYLLEEYVKLARAGRVTADLFDVRDLPEGVSSVDIPKITSGTVVAAQTTQNTAVSNVDLTTGSLTSGIITLAGKNVVSQQLIDQSGIPFDQIVLEDLTADLARQVGTQVLIGVGGSAALRGFLTPASTSVVTWTTTTPTATGLYGRLAQLQGQINSTRFRAPDAICMHPRRWAWFASYVDNSGRPLVVPTAGGFNAMGNPDAVQGVGHVGSVLGCDVYTDANIPINLGAGTNQDIILMMPRKDIKLWQSSIRAEAFSAPYADSLGVLYRCHQYLAMVPDRYLASLGQISGTALTPPVFTG